jgi:ligand-binding sensor domain-containing protein
MAARSGFGFSPCVRDRKGNIWLASGKGIIRYDGKSFTSKISSPEINKENWRNGFWDVLEDRKGNYWFASIGSGVYYYDGKSFRNFTTKEGLVNNDVFTIYEDKAADFGKS